MWALLLCVVVVLQCALVCSLCDKSRRATESLLRQRASLVTPSVPAKASENASFVNGTCTLWALAKARCLSMT
jgi:hypothetical protein